MPRINNGVVVGVANMYDSFISQGNNPSDFGQNISVPQLDNLIYNNLFPKVKQVHNVQTDLRNKFSKFAQIVSSAGELIEEYVVADITPVQLGLDKPATKMFQRNYPKILSTLYTNQVAKKVKVTLDTKEVRKRFISGDSLVDYFNSVFSAVYNAIARTEQEEWLEAFVSFYRGNDLVNNIATTTAELPQVIGKSIMDLTDNTNLFNQGDSVDVPLTMSADLSDIYIITTTDISALISANIFPQYFDTEGIDFRDRILAFHKFPKVNVLLADYTVNEDDVKALENINYMVDVNDIIPKDSVIPQAWIRAGFGADAEIDEYEFDSKNFGFILDSNAIRYAIDEGSGWTDPFKNGEFMESTMWYHYTSLKAISPFYNKCTFSIGTPPTK